MPNRSRIYDEIAGLLIIYMVIYHVMQWSGMQNSMGMEILSYLNFFMPWFFYKGGLFFKEREMLPALQKSFKRLILPYIEWSFVGAVIFGYIACFREHTHTVPDYLKMNIYQLLTEGSVPGNQALWFLFALFAVRIIMNLCQNKRIPVVYPTIFGISFSVFFHFTGFVLPHYFTYISSGLFFFGLGFLLKDLSQNKHFQLTCILIYLILSIFSKPIVDIRTNSLLDGYYLLWPIWSAAGIITLNTLFENLHKISNASICSCTLEWVGKHSMTIYVVHWPIIMIVFRILL